MSWHARGSLDYLIVQGERLGISRVTIDRARRNVEIHRIATLLGQLSQQYHRLPRDAQGEPVFVGGMLRGVEGTLHQCEEECAKLHALAAASQAMIDDARVALRLSAAERPMRVACDFDEAEPSSAVNGAAKVPAGQEI
jgi:hypothetical protein